VSGDLVLTIPSIAGFAEAACAAFVERYGFELVFPEGFDLYEQAGWLPCSVAVSGAGQTLDTGFEAYLSGPRDAPGNEELLLCVSDDGPAWVLAHAVAAYFVSELGGQLEDPQSGKIYSRDNVGALNSAVSELLAEVAW